MSRSPLLPLSCALAFCNAILTVALVTLESSLVKELERDFDFEGSIQPAPKSNESSSCSATSDCGNAANCASIGVDSAIFDQTG